MGKAQEFSEQRLSYPASKRGKKSVGQEVRLMALWLHKEDAHEKQTRDTHRDPIRDTFGPYTEAGQSNS